MLNIYIVCAAEDNESQGVKSGAAANAQWKFTRRRTRDFAKLNETDKHKGPIIVYCTVLRERSAGSALAAPATTFPLARTPILSATRKNARKNKNWVPFPPDYVTIRTCSFIIFSAILMFPDNSRRRYECKRIHKGGSKKKKNKKRTIIQFRKHNNAEKL